MGQEVKCKARLGKRTSIGKAILESDRLIFCGEFRLDIPLTKVTRTEAKRGRLIVTYSEGLVTFNLGSTAQKWAWKIGHPRTLLDKLGVRADTQISLIGVKDADFQKKIREKTKAISETRALKKSDMIFIQADDREDLNVLGSLRTFIKPDGAIWLITPKGVEHIRESDALQAGKAAGLVDVKVVSFSESHTAHKFVIPLVQR